MSTRNTKHAWGWLMGMTTSIRPVAFWEWAGIGSVAIATLLVTATTAEAGQLTQWRYDEATHQLELTVSDETTPRHFMLAQPARIVVDLPDTQVGDVALEQTFVGAVRSVRISQFQPDLARIVIELSPDAVLASGQVEIQQIADTQWAVNPLLAGDSMNAEINAEPVAIAPSPIPSDVPAPVTEATPSVSTPAAEPIAPVAPVTDPAISSSNTEAETLPPLEPGAIELSVTPPSSMEESDVAAEPIEETSASETSDFSVPSISTVIAEMDVGEFQAAPPTEEDEIAIALDPESESLDVEVTEATVTESEHQFDPTAPVLDATMPTPPPQPVLDATRPSVAIPSPQTAATSPQAALTQLNTTARQATEAVDIPVTPSPQIDAQPHESSANVDTDPEAIAPATISAESDPHETSEESVPESAVMPMPSAAESAPMSSTIAFGQPIEAETAAAPELDVRASAASVMTVSLRYPGAEPLALNPGIRQDVLLLEQPLHDGQGNLIAEAGSPVIGRFETSDTGSKFVIQAITTQTENIRVTGESQPLTIQSSSATEEAIAPESSPDFNPASLFSGMASSTVARIQPSHVVIQPDQIITVQLTDNLASR